MGSRSRGRRSDGGRSRVVTISGSSADDLVVISSANGSAITIASDNVVNQRTDCSGGTGGPVFWGGPGHDDLAECV